MNTVSKNRKPLRIVCTTVLVVIAVFWMIPVFWLVLNSFKTNIEFVSGYSNVHSPMEYIRAVLPERINLGSYISLFTGEGLSTASHLDVMIRNSLIVSISHTAIVVVVSSLAAYAYERLNFPIGDKIFWVLFFISLVPASASLLPLFKICNSFGWLNNLNALIWPGTSSIMSVFLLRNFMTSIPKDLDEAARIDGAGSFQIYMRIIVPSVKPVLMIVGLNAFRAAWNDYLWPSIAMTDPVNQTLTAGMALLSSQYGNAQWTNLLASTVISMIVPLLLYLTCQKYFLEGIKLRAAVKG